MSNKNNLKVLTFFLCFFASRLSVLINFMKMVLL